MQLLTTLLHVLLALFGVDTGGDTFSHRDTIDGIDRLYSIAKVESGMARFQCIASDSGNCYYTVFPASCNDGPSLVGTHIGRCDAGPPREFALPAGGEREIAGLDVRALCVRGDETPVLEDCQSGTRQVAKQG